MEFKIILITTVMVISLFKSSVGQFMGEEEIRDELMYLTPQKIRAYGGGGGISQNFKESRPRINKSPIYFINKNYYYKKKESLRHHEYALYQIYHEHPHFKYQETPRAPFRSMLDPNLVTDFLKVYKPIQYPFQNTEVIRKQKKYHIIPYENENYVQGKSGEYEFIYNVNPIHRNFLSTNAKLTYFKGKKYDEPQWRSFGKPPRSMTYPPAPAPVYIHFDSSRSHLTDVTKPYKVSTPIQVPGQYSATNHGMDLMNSRKILTYPHLEKQTPGTKEAVAINAGKTVLTPGHKNVQIDKPINVAKYIPTKSNKDVTHAVPVDNKSYLIVRNIKNHNVRTGTLNTFDFDST